MVENGAGELHGIQILSIIYDKIMMTIGVVQMCMIRLFDALCSVFLVQTKQWIHSTTLHDPLCEYFIVEVRETTRCFAFVE